MYACAFCTWVGWPWGWSWLLGMLLCAFLYAFFGVHLAVPCGTLAGCVVPGHRLHMFSTFPFIAKLLSKVVVWVAAHPISAVPELALTKLESIKPANQGSVQEAHCVDRISLIPSEMGVGCRDVQGSPFCEVPVYITLHILSGRCMSYAC